MSQKRPTVWNYVSFSRPSSRFDSYPILPTEDDKFEKPARRSAGPGSGSGSGFSPLTYANSYGKPAWRTATSSSRWLKLGAAIGVLLLVFYVLAPGGKTGQDVRQGHSALADHSEEMSAGDSSTLSASSMTKCSKSSDPSKPLIQYALMIDAGSTGSRIHVYRFNNCGDSPELEEEVLFKQTEPKKGGSGLSSYDSDAEGAARSLDVLLDAAVAAVPIEYRSCSPIAVKATAGLRKLGEVKAEKTLAAVRTRLETVYPFPIQSAANAVEVMDGKDEGVYAWITTNYLLGKIGSATKSPTAAVFDLGGGSTQIVFEPNFAGSANAGMPAHMEEGDHRYELSFGGRDFTLYQHSYLGFGLMAARENLHQLVLLEAHASSLQAGAEPFDPSQPLENPCIAPGQSLLVDVALPPAHALGISVTVNMTGPAAPAAAQCQVLTERILYKEAPCALTPCAFNGVYQPSLAQTYANEEIYLFSYFYDRMAALGMPEQFTLAQLADVTWDVCAGAEDGSWSRFAKTDGAMEELAERAEFCLDLNFMLGLLTKGYEMPIAREVRMAKKIAGKELGWCLGASLPLLSQEGWTCKIREVS